MSLTQNAARLEKKTTLALNFDPRAEAAIP
jgi:hypothetical protein